MLLSCTEKDLHIYCSSQHHIPEPHSLCSPQGWLAAIHMFTGYRAWAERAIRHQHPARFQILILPDQKVTFWSKGCSRKQPTLPTFVMKTHLEGAQENKIHNLKLHLLTWVFPSSPHTSTWHHGENLQKPRWGGAALDYGCHDIQKYTEYLYTVYTSDLIQTCGSDIEPRITGAPDRLRH